MKREEKDASIEDADVKNGTLRLPCCERRLGRLYWYLPSVDLSLLLVQVT
ncbi:hypothetical protein O9993_00530 [Vibrio lentus]|nr:hypothetical protein [Vibrio lentus]